NHIHAELNRDGAERRTPWFRRSQPTPAPIPVPTPQQPSGPPIVRPTLAVGVNYPPPPGYRAMRSVSKEIVAKANEILRRPEPIGTIFPVILGGKDYMFVLEWHKHAQGAPGDPLLNWHRGVTVYERIGGAQLPVPVPLPPPPPPTPPSYSPSATRRRFEEAVARGDWQQAYLNLNGLNMYEMLRTLDGLSYERCNALLQQRENYRGMVNMPRIEYAAEVVQTGRLPSIAPGDLEATGQVETAREFLGSRRSQPGRSSSSPKYIRWVQNSLNQILGLRLAVDVISGPQTRSAIRSFQQRRGLTVDGIVG